MIKDFASNSLSQGSIEQDYLASNVKKSKFLLCLIKISISVLNKLKNQQFKTCSWACYEIKKSVGRKFDTFRCCRKWFSISYRNRKLRNSEWPLKRLGERFSTYWESWFSRIGQNVHLSDAHDRFDVIKLFHLLLNSIEINLLKYVLLDKMWSRTIGELNIIWAMPKIFTLQKL